MGSTSGAAIGLRSEAGNAAGVTGVIPAGRFAATGGRRGGRSTSKTSTVSENDTHRAATAPSAPATNEPPSNTSSSCPPTRFTHTTGTPASATRWAITRSRAACLPTRNGDPLTFTTNCAPARASSLTGPSGKPRRPRTQ